MTSTYGRLSRKVLGAALAGTLGLSAAAALVPGVASAAQTVTATRVAGTDRYGTAANNATTAFPSGSNSIVLASGENFPDGLSAASLAGALNAPVLLTAKDSLPAVTASTLATIDAGQAGTATVYIVGGTSAVSQTVRTQLTALGYTLNETSGTDRYDTSGKVAVKANGISAPATFNGLKTAIVATGETFPDALAAGALAFRQKLPIILTPTATLGSAASTTLTTLGIQQAIVMGGTSAVSQATRDALTAKGVTLVAISGTNRNDTAAKLAALEVKSTGTGGFNFGGGTGPVNVVLVSGLNFPDALAAAPLAGLNQAPMLLMASLPAETSAFLTTWKTTITTLYVEGGTSTISDADVASAKTASSTATPTATISATAGSDTATIVFSEDVPTGSTLASSYTLNNGSFPGAITYSSPTKTATLQLSAGGGHPAFLAGDVVGIVTNTIKSADGRAVAATSFTVVADTTKPTATLKAYAGTTTAYIFFSEPVSTAITTGLDATDITTSHTGFTVVGQPTAVPASSKTVFKVTFSGTLVVGDSVTLGTGWTDQAGNAPLTTTATSAVTDTSPPVVNSAKLLSVPTQASQNVGATGLVKITALATGAAAGAAGNGWAVVTVDNNSALSIATNAASKTITIASDADNTAGQQVSATTASAALNADSTFASLFTASVATANIFNPTSGTTSFTNGATSGIVTVTFNEGVDPATVAPADFEIDVNGDGVYEAITPTVDPTNGPNGTVSVTFTVTSPLNVLTAGTSRIRVANTGNTISDLPGNATTSGQVVTLS